MHTSTQQAQGSPAVLPFRRPPFRRLILSRPPRLWLSWSSSPCIPVPSGARCVPGLGLQTHFSPFLAVSSIKCHPVPTSPFDPKLGCSTAQSHPNLSQFSTDADCSPHGLPHLGERHHHPCSKSKILLPLIPREQVLPRHWIPSGTPHPQHQPCHPSFSNHFLILSPISTLALLPIHRSPRGSHYVLSQMSLDWVTLRHTEDRAQCLLWPRLALPTSPHSLPSCSLSSPLASVCELCGSRAFAQAVLSPERLLPGLQVSA